jgi:hypothetical protein
MGCANMARGVGPAAGPCQAVVYAYLRPSTQETSAKKVHGATIKVIKINNKSIIVFTMSNLL